MSDTPDLSRIVNLIMENPSLIAEISALAKGDKESSESTADAPKPEAEAPASLPIFDAPVLTRNEKRQRLLSAMKPYLKDERSRAIDSILSVAEILDMVRNK